MNIVPNAEDIKIYNVSIGKTLPQWVKDKRKKGQNQKDPGKSYFQLKF